MTVPASSVDIYGELSWPELRDCPQLQAKEFHLWYASLSVSAKRLQFHESCLDNREKARLERYSTKRSKQRFIAARGILRELLGMYIDCAPSSVKFNYGPLGKPYLHPQHNLRIHFNSSDSGDSALFAFSKSGELGVDLELASRPVRHEVIAPRKLTRYEYKKYQSCPHDRRRKFFLALWTRKEAYGKAKGIGIRYRLNSVNLLKEKLQERVSVEDENGVVWEIVQITTGEIIACVVTEGKGFASKVYRFPGDAISAGASSS